MRMTFSVCQKVIGVSWSAVRRLPDLTKSADMMLHANIVRNSFTTSSENAKYFVNHYKINISKYDM